MTGNEYQRLAMRTAHKDPIRQRKHALLGIPAEVGELLSLYQKVEQGHLLDDEHAMLEAGDILWMVTEYCSSMGWRLEDVMQRNIDKLRLRYPYGFDPERSLHRAFEGVE